MSDIINIKVTQLQICLGHFQKVKSNFTNTSYNTFKTSYIKTCGDPVVQKMATTLENMYNSISNLLEKQVVWLQEYITSVEQLEEKLSTTSSVEELSTTDIKTILDSLIPFQISAIPVFGLAGSKPYLNDPIQNPNTNKTNKEIVKTLLDPSNDPNITNPSLKGSVFEKPAPIPDTSKKLSEFLYSWEGTGPTVKDKDGNITAYVVYDDGGGVATVGHGQTLKWEKSSLERAGIDVESLTIGSKVNKEAVDRAYQDSLNNNYRSHVEDYLKENNIKLEPTQVDALVSRYYNCGDIEKFNSNYKKYGNTDALYENYLSLPIKNAKGQVEPGLIRRREAEWELFHNGNYQKNE